LSRMKIILFGCGGSSPPPRGALQASVFPHQCRRWFFVSRRIHGIHTHRPYPATDRKRQVDGGIGPCFPANRYVFSAGAAASAIFFCAGPQSAAAYPATSSASTGLGDRRPDCKSFAKPEIFIVDRRLVKQILFVLIIGKVDAVDAHNFIIFFWFIQNHCQPGPDSAKALLNQPNGSDARLLEHLEKFSFRCFRYRYLNHHTVLRFIFRHQYKFTLE